MEISLTSRINNLLIYFLLSLTFTHASKLGKAEKTGLPFRIYFYSKQTHKQTNKQADKGVVLCFLISSAYND